MERYRALLTQILELWRKFGVQGGWPGVLERWIRELDSLAAHELPAHLERTFKALWGMGSIGDVVIFGDDGNYSNAPEIQAANAKLMEVTLELGAEIKRQLARQHG